MWGLVIGSISIILTIVFSLAKASSKREENTKGHQQELVARKKAEIDFDEKNITGNNAKEPEDR